MSAFESTRDGEAVAAGSNRNFGLVVGGAFLAIGAWPLIHGAGVRWWALALGAVLGAGGLIKPDWLQPLNKAWMLFGLILGKIVTPVVMGVLLYAVIAPVGLIQRWSGRDQMRLKLDPDAKSYWEFRDPPGPAPDSMTDQF